MIQERIQERRQFSRSQAILPVYMAKHGQRSQRYQSHDLSVRGTFLRIRPLGMSVGEQVQLVFVVSLGRVIKLYRLAARVTRIANDGVGLQFCKESSTSPGV
jgi:PilZ domain